MKYVQYTCIFYLFHIELKQDRNKLFLYLNKKYNNLYKYQNDF